MAGDDNKLSLNTDSSLLFMARIHNNKLNLYFFWVETVNLLVLTQNQFPIKNTQNQSFTNNDQIGFHQQLRSGQRHAVVVWFEERKQRYKWESNSAKGERKPNTKLN